MFKRRKLQANVGKRNLMSSSSNGNASELLKEEKCFRYHGSHVESGVETEISYRVNEWG